MIDERSDAEGRGSTLRAVKKSTGVKIMSNVLTVDVKPGNAPLIRDQVIEIAPL